MSHHVSPWIIAQRIEYSVIAFCVLIMLMDIGACIVGATK